MLLQLEEAYKKRPANLDCHPCEMALDIVARKVEKAKANNGGVVKYNAITDIVESMKPTIPWRTKGMLRNYVNKMKREAVRASAVALNNSSKLSPLTLSSLTFDTTGTALEENTGKDKAGGRPKGGSANSKRTLTLRERLALRA